LGFRIRDLGVLSDVLRRPMEVREVPGRWSGHFERREDRHIRCILYCMVDDRLRNEHLETENLGGKWMHKEICYV
jgi:hypothetical protein